MSTRKQNRLDAKNFIDTLSVTPYPNSEKTYIQGSRSDLQVPMRKISLSDSLIGGNQDNPVYEPNEPIHVYDTSGLYTDPQHDIDLYNGLPKLREQWIEERLDTEVLDGVTSEFAKERLADETLDELRYGQLPRIRRATDGACVTQLHYARKGIITPEMEYIAIRENMGRQKLKDEMLTQQHPGQHLRVCPCQSNADIVLISSHDL